MNFFDAELKKEGKQYTAYIGDAKINVPECINTSLLIRDSVPEKVTLGVRPENLIICPKGTPSSIRAEIKVTEMMGSEIHIHAECEGGKKVILRVQIPYGHSGAAFFRLRAWTKGNAAPHKHAGRQGMQQRGA